jgi:hypothetical protein
VKKLLNPIVYASIYKEGVGNPALDHRKMVWNPITGQGSSSLGKAAHEWQRTHIFNQHV